MYLLINRNAGSVSEAIGFGNGMVDINLQQLPDDYFGGECSVENRVLNRNDLSIPQCL